MEVNHAGGRHLSLNADDTLLFPAVWVNFVVERALHSITL